MRDRSEILAPRPQIQLQRPGAALLVMEIPIGLRDCIRMQQPIEAALLHQLWDSRQQTIPLDAAIDNQMTDMNVLRSIFPGNALREITQSRLRGCERRKSSLAP